MGLFGTVDMSRSATAASNVVRTMIANLFGFVFPRDRDNYSVVFIGRSHHGAYDSWNQDTSLRIRHSPFNRGATPPRNSHLQCWRWIGGRRDKLCLVGRSESCGQLFMAVTHRHLSPINCGLDAPFVHDRTLAELVPPAWPKPTDHSSRAELSEWSRLSPCTKVAART